MAENDKKEKKPTNFHVRFRSDQAEWLHKRVKGAHRNVPQVIRRLVDKEIIKEELNAEKRKR